jgi:hypothetical protein
VSLAVAVDDHRHQDARALEEELMASRDSQGVLPVGGDADGHRPAVRPAPDADAAVEPGTADDRPAMASSS